MYKDIVLPIEVTKINGDLELGSCFIFLNGIVTAKHCLFDNLNREHKNIISHVAIKGYANKILNGANIYISKDENIDLAYIADIPCLSSALYTYNKGEVLDDVLVMGYPKLPYFSSFLTAEKAKVSSVSNRLTPTTGSIAAFGSAVSPREELMLITARIRGGNSGGPVISNTGGVVGIATNLAYAEEVENSDFGNAFRYDEMGYGIAYPVETIIGIAKGDNVQLDLPEDYFVDFTA